MADTNDDGGPAFPLPKAAFPVITEKPPQVAGMTLLDYFAGQAMQILLAKHPECTDEHIAQCAYMLAAAMIAEKRRRESTK